jgi:1-deoxy-D-xylulose-5-phosphate synthase
VLREIKEMNGPRMLHLSTKKGKGYTPAEKEATIWHAPGKFDVESGTRAEAQKENPPKRFQDIFGEALLELAKMNDKVVGVTPAMPTGCSMNILMNEMPDRAFDVGIAEGHAVTFSAGMAKEGMVPFCNIYSSFAQRAYDNVIHDAALLNLPVVLCLDRAGIVGEDGPTHHGVFDLASLRPIPNLTIASPYDENELRDLMYTAQLPGKGTFVIRYPRGCGRNKKAPQAFAEIPVGRGRCLKEGTDLAIVTIGPIGNMAEDAIAKYEAQSGRSIAHYDLRFLKPLDEEMLHEIGKKFQKIITLEDGCIIGGMGSAVMEFMNDHGYTAQIRRLGIPDHFVEHGKPAELYHLLGIDEEGICNTIDALLHNK